MSDHFKMLPTWTTRLRSVMHMHIVVPLVQKIAESDAQLATALNAIGWHLSYDNPQVRSRESFAPSDLSSRSVSVFTRNLPMELLQSPAGPNLQAIWQTRQVLESYVNHPSFDTSQREMNLARIQEWARTTMTVGELGRRPDGGPTVSHYVFSNSELERILF